MTFRTTAALLCLSLAWTSAPTPTARAASRVLLVYGPGMPTAEAEARARDEGADLLGRARDSAEAIHVTEVPFPGPGPAWIVGEAVVRPCSGDRRSVEDLRGDVDRAAQMMEALQDDHAGVLLHDAWEALPCVGEMVSQELLYDLHFMRGMQAFVAGDETTARAHFTAAVETAPDRRFDTGYAPEIQQLYLQAREDRMLMGVQDLALMDPGGDAVELRIDAHVVDPEEGVVQISPGSHLVQVRDRAGVVGSFTVEVPAGDSRAALVTRSGHAGALLSPDEDRFALAVAQGALRELARRHGAAAVVGVRLRGGGGPAAYRYDARRDRLGVSGGGGGRGGGGSHRIALAGAAGGVFYAVRDVAPARSGYGSLGLLLEVPVWRRLAIDFGGWLSARGAEPDASGRKGVYVLPAGRLGVHVSLAEGVARPYVGGGVFMALHQIRDEHEVQVSVRPALGVVGVAGLAIEPWRTVRFVVDAHVGGGAMFVAHGNVGLGLRF